MPLIFVDPVANDLCRRDKHDRRGAIPRRRGQGTEKD
jgi:hypothetical protein